MMRATCIAFLFYASLECAGARGQCTTQPAVPAPAGQYELDRALAEFGVAKPADLARLLFGAADAAEGFLWFDYGGAALCFRVTEWQPPNFSVTLEDCQGPARLAEWIGKSVSGSIAGGPGRLLVTLDTAPALRWYVTHGAVVQRVCSCCGAQVGGGACDTKRCDAELPCSLPGTASTQTGTCAWQEPRGNRWAELALIAVVVWAWRARGMVRE